MEEETQSLCPICLKVIPAARVIRGDDVFIEKRCPDHGDFSTITWRGKPGYREWGMGVFAPGPEKLLSETVRGCPYDCGPCPQHQAQTCSVLMEVTDRCNLGCSVCFASSHGETDPAPDLDVIRGMLETIIDAAGTPPLQLSGGEPTVREDLPQIVSLAKEMGFGHVQINTHGLRLATDYGYLERLKEAGVDLIYLQFDGVSDDVYLKMRGRRLFDLKRQAIENCVQARIGVQLVPTLVPGINDHEIGSIVEFAKRYIPYVKGVHFQPVSYFGRYPSPPSDAHRITTPDVLRALEAQTRGEVKAANFQPRRRRDSHCGFSGFFVLEEDGRLIGTTVFKPRKVSGDEDGKTTTAQPSEHVRRFITEKARYIEPNPEVTERYPRDAIKGFIERARTHFLSISGMPFQDAWTVDLERLKGCCIHVITRQKKLVPFCAYYITSTAGDRLIAIREKI